MRHPISEVRFIHPQQIGRHTGSHFILNADLTAQGYKAWWDDETDAVIFALPDTGQPRIYPASAINYLTLVESIQVQAKDMTTAEAFALLAKRLDELAKGPAHDDHKVPEPLQAQPGPAASAAQHKRTESQHAPEVVGATQAGPRAKSGVQKGR